MSKSVRPFETVLGALSVAVLGMLMMLPAFAQSPMKWQGSGGWGYRGQYSRMYDAATVETVRGEVLDVLQFTPRRGMRQGVHLLLKTDEGTISVHLGPAWFIENQDITIEPKDQIEVTGSRITFDGKPAIIAAEIKKGKETLILRDKNGLPAWS